jgi:hypothetical protein
MSIEGSSRVFGRPSGETSPSRSRSVRAARGRRLGTDGLGHRVAVAGFVLGLLAARRQRIPSLDELADRIDRARGTHGLVRTALASESGAAQRLAAPRAHAVARADALLPRRWPSGGPAVPVAGLRARCDRGRLLLRFGPSSLAPSSVVESLPGFHATGVGRDDPPPSRSERTIAR